MFTQDSRKPTLVISVLFISCCLYAGNLVLLNRASIWAEQELGAFPFQQEDWLRYITPSQFTRKNRDRIMLTGPSTVRENLLYEQFTAAFPEHVIYQGGISLGTIDDVNAALDYIEGVHGTDSLPRIIVLGISPRFIANIPEERPFRKGIDRYSPYFNTIQGNAGIDLEPKGFFESVVARLRFFQYKKPEQYRTALLAVLSYSLSGVKIGDAIPGMVEKTFLQRQSDRLFKHPVIKHLIANTRFKRALDHDFTEVLAWMISPYKYRLDPPAKQESLVEWSNSPDSWWRLVYTWNPVDTEQQARTRLKRLTEFVDTHGIRLLVINMPERDISRANYHDENYRAYISIIVEAVGDERFLDLSDFLEQDEFYDLEHSVYPGSLRLTNEVIRNIKGIPD